MIEPLVRFDNYWYVVWQIIEQVLDSMTTRHDFPYQMLSLSSEFNSKFGDQWSMVSSEEAFLFDDDIDHDNPYALGGKISFVPILGDIIWELPHQIADNTPFSAYISRIGKNDNLGYVRVPHYNPTHFNEKVINVFSELISRFESSTSTVVLDQVNNPGGSMFYMYAILSTLTYKNLDLPIHKITIDENEVAKATDIVDLARASDSIPENERPSPELLNYSRFILSEFKAGRGTHHNPAGPVYLSGRAKIYPSKNHYSKRLIVLINPLTFSAPEFLAAILQDNERATLFGTRTAGAGGCAKRLVIPEAQKSGISYFTIRWTLAKRTNGQLIEKVGVHPDVKYKTTVDDIRSGYDGYRHALLETINAA